MNEIQVLTQEIISFINARDWYKFHKPKDTALALFIEASELNEAFLWKNETEVNIEKIKEELADVMIYSLDLAHQYNLNIEEIIRAKLKINADKYPIDKSKGNATKYSEL